MSAEINWRKWIIILCAIGVMAWAVVALGIMPSVIARAYDGQGLGPLVRMMSHRDEHGLDHYQAKFLNLAVIALAFWVLVLLLPVVTTSKWFEERIVGRATPGALGAMRMFVSLIAIDSALKDNTLSAVNLVAAGAKPIPMGVMDFAYRWLGFEHIVGSYDALLTFKVATIFLLAMTAIGLFTRPVIVLATVFYLLLQGVQRSFYWFNHTGLVPFYVLLVLCFVRCGDGFSLDRIIRIWRHKPVADPDKTTTGYGWARWFVWLAICIPYIMAGLSKLANGTLMWWESKNLMAIVYRNALRPDYGEHGWVLDSPWFTPWFFTFAGISTIITELGMVLCLVSRRARWIFPPIAVAMHYGILKVMLIPFYDLMLIQALFWDWRSIRLWLSSNIAKFRSRSILLFDDQCRLCRRSVGILRGLDLFKRLDFVGFRSLDFDHFNKVQGVNVCRERANTEMILIRQGRTWGGYSAYQQMTMMIPLLMPVAPLMMLPGVSHLGRGFYSWIAKNRLSFFQCHDTCELTPGVVPFFEESARRKYRLAAILACVVPLFMFGAWLRRTEFYPVSSFQMFTLYHDAYDNSGTVTYYRLFAEYADGTRSLAYPEKLAPGVGSRYWGMIPGSFKTDPKLYPDRKRLGDLLVNVGRQFNSTQTENEKRINRFLVQEHRWDFINARDDRAYGQVVRHFEIPFDESESTQPSQFLLVDGPP